MFDFRKIRPTIQRTTPLSTIAFMMGLLVFAAIGGAHWSRIESQPDDAYRRTLFINFRGVTLTKGAWDPVKNTAGMPLHKSGPNKAVFPFYSPPCKTDSDCRVGSCSYPMPERKAFKYNPFKEKPFKRCSKPDPLFEKQVVYYAKKIFEQFNVRIVSERPASGDYDMIVMNYNSTVGVPHGGSAGFTCDANRGNMIAFVQDSRWGHGPKNLANIIAHEFGHTLGLAHTDAQTRTDPMGAGGWGLDIPRFEDRCLKHDRGARKGCEITKQHCPAGQHNTHRIVMDRLGPRQHSEALVFPQGEAGLVFTAYHGQQKSDRREMLCQDSSYLVGLEWHYGAIIDRVRGICSNGAATGDLGANSGNGPDRFVCDKKSGDRIESIAARAFGYGDAIEKLTIKCKSGQSKTVGGWGDDGKLQKPALACPPGSRPVGLSGNKGAWLNAIALACRSESPAPPEPGFRVRGGDARPIPRID
ncbi:MAG: hypothetical protein NXI24_19225 [bacterium]|nr:hypothetical protein [bacterium]